ncbi:MAG: DUF4253 domain-containing protein [Acidobacteria bacterium]|nr:DUF4253 domain-containing protein [Acidobacteriota bacterium]
MNPEIEIIEVPGTEALLRLFELQEAQPESGKYPFLIGDAASLRMLREAAEFNDDPPAEIVEKALKIRVRSLFEKLKKSALPYEIEAERYFANLEGEWEEKVSMRDIGFHWNDLVRAHRDVLTRKFFKKCHLGLAPTTDSWRLPALVRYGGWNDCPKPAEHCAIHRYWQEKYGAEIVSLTGDVIECRVANPPPTEEDSRRLAWEQFAYCSDIVTQGAGTVGALASSLRDSPYWYFWWD